MKVVLQRVLNANVSVANHTVGSIGRGLMILLGIESEDDENDAEWLVKKVAALRIFNDDKG